MKYFLTQILLLLLMVVVSIYFIFARANGYTDPFYVRFTTPKQNNLIIGTSRAAQGLQPKVFKEMMNINIYNYSFSIIHSPFGPTYLESIKRKLNPSTRNGVFIISIDPWSISSRYKDPNDLSNFIEINLCLGNTKIVDINPNPIYLLNNLGDKYYTLLYHKSSKTFLHNDGWLDVSTEMDFSSVEKRIEKKIQEYRKNNLPIYKFSGVRLKYLIITIQYLNEYGKVYLIRLPVHPRMMDIDNNLMPDFESKIREAVGMAAGYLDMTKNNSDFQYTDGNHLYKESGQKLSRIIAEWILYDGI